MRESERGELTPEDEATLRASLTASARIFAHEGLLTPEELAAEMAQWARMRDKVASGAIALSPDELSPYAASRLEWLQEQAHQHTLRKKGAV